MTVLEQALEGTKSVAILGHVRPDPSQVFILDWNKGMRFGIVTKAEPDSVVMAYVRALQQQLPSLSEKLFGLKLEPVEES